MTLRLALTAALLFAAPAAEASALAGKIAKVAKSKAPGTKQVGEVFEATGEKKGDRTDWHLELDPANCYWFVGQGADSIERIALFLFVPDEGMFGGRAADKKSTTASAVMMHCPETSGMFRLQAKIIVGSGDYAVGVFAKKAPKKAVKKEDNPEERLGPLVKKQAKKIARGAKLDGELFSSDSEQKDWQLMLEQGSCYWIVAVGDDDIDALYLYWWNPDDKRVTQNKSKSRKSSMGHCAKETGMYRVQTKINDGEGFYVFGLYKK